MTSSHAATVRQQLPSTHHCLIVAGAEKCGTTSLFGYLSAHPQVRSSVVKETDYFRREDVSLDGYLAQFHRRNDESALLVESSPGYLAEAQAVAPRVASVVPDARLLFVLRDPIDRVRSSFRFYKSRLHVPEAMTLDDFVDRCLRFDGSAASAQSLALKPWHLRALERGRYDLLLPEFERRFPPSQILLLRFEALNRNTGKAVSEVCRFAGIDGGFYDDFEFARENAGFTAKRRGVQRVALLVNNRLERLWRRHPALKRRLLSTYKRFNAQPDAPSDELSPALLAQVRTYYEPTYRFLDQAFRAVGASPQPAAATGQAPCASGG